MTTAGSETEAEVGKAKDRNMQRIRFLELAGAPTAPLVLATLTLLLSAGLPGSAGGADTDALYRALGGRPRDEKASNSAPSEPERAADAKSAARAEFHERIKPYLSSGGYYSLFRAARVAGEGAVPSGLPQAIAPESPNVQVNDSRGEVCGSGCTQSETSIPVPGTHAAIGLSDAHGPFVDTL